jgi:hypothetical protein
VHRTNIETTALNNLAVFGHDHGFGEQHHTWQIQTIAPLILLVRISADRTRHVDFANTGYDRIHLNPYVRLSV